MNENLNYAITFSECIPLQNQKEKIVQRRALLMGQRPRKDFHKERLPVNCCATSTAEMLPCNEHTNK